VTDRKNIPLVVTRPSDQASELLSSLSVLDNDVRHHPLIDIRGFRDDGTPESSAVKQRILDIDGYHSVIAISQNAAEAGLAWLDDYWPQHPVGITWYAVGPTTAEVLRGAGLPVEMPAERFDSEGVLALDGLQAAVIEGEKILIWRGVGGRETLASVLRQRGARVDYAELYERRQIDYSGADWDAALEDGPLLLLSSGQALDIAMEQVADLPQRVAGILVPSTRVADQARARGFREVLVAASARNEDTLHSLRAWLAAADR